ncbi:MAG: DUF116 domain-containing protein [Candidatus Zixiibacteriota bacterium]
MTRKTPPTFLLKDDFYSKLEQFTSEVLEKGLALFEDEFKNIDTFYERACSDGTARDDHQFRRTPRPFYLLEALAFQLYDRSRRKSFNSAKNTVIILPQCLSLMQEKCQRKKTRYGKVCDRCVPNCQINKIMQLADRYGVAGYFSQRKLEEQLRRLQKKYRSLSVIGISCILTLASGMRTAGELGVPARGVFLNFTGCRHWSDTPFATETALDRVEMILREKYELSDSSA